MQLICRVLKISIHTLVSISNKGFLNLTLRANYLKTIWSSYKLFTTYNNTNDWFYLVLQFDFDILHHIGINGFKHYCAPTHPVIKTITKTFSPRWKVRSHKLKSSLTRLSNLRSWQARRLQNNNLKFWTTKFKIHKIQKNFSLKFWTKLFSINLNYTVYILQIIT